MLDASALTLGVPATALPDAALAAAGLPSAQQMAADSVSTDRALDPPSYSTEGAGAEPWSSCMVAMGAGCSGVDGVESLSLNRTRKVTASCISTYPGSSKWSRWLPTGMAGTGKHHRP